MIPKDVSPHSPKIKKTHFFVTVVAHRRDYTPRERMRGGITCLDFARASFENEYPPGMHDIYIVYIYTIYISKRVV